DTPSSWTHPLSLHDALPISLRMIYGPDAAWTPPVLTCSGLTGAGLDTVWQQLMRHREQLVESGELEARRQQQQVDWVWAMVRDRSEEHTSELQSRENLVCRL